MSVVSRGRLRQLLFASMVAFLLAGSHSMKVESILAVEAGFHAEVLPPTGLAAGSQLVVNYEVGSSFGATFYVFLYSRQQITEYFDRLDDDSSSPSVLCGSPSIAREPIQSGTGNITLLIRATDQYTAYVAACSTAAPVVVSFEMAFVNPDSTGRLSQNLPLEVIPCIQLQCFLAVCYLLLLAAWLNSCVRNWSFVSPVHVLVALILVTKAVSSSIFSFWYPTNKEIMSSCPT